MFTVLGKILLDGIFLEAFSRCRFYIVRTAVKIDEKMANVACYSFMRRVKINTT